MRMHGNIIIVNEERSIQTLKVFGLSAKEFKNAQSIFKNKNSKKLDF
ncbi:hypothetical protein HMPREF1411_00312 [Helicobacter pylori GAM250AFi]|nr:hypothetical protein HMPREF1411_00312 [Helicobacter pylori GAM250AFi]EMH12119.1 hypothetical protein HMPREF1412_01517 [Helicobacter pylori GAM250T]EMH14298.1 hypothetical protein HMPREF1413_00979 [Helicobacter pylori GAM252Bi]EMH16510.1 hypothetical protein HMPREF1414_00190 [Helicobacter pylori GAM252T]EMH47363.1 hypothetical protein HMPREF1439_01038 [Helicobacter pylori HP250AFiii]EMH48988.1 hypothetical protein HMPREF1438_00437 [Helicobacter pylori HP250AFii]EMH51441.1 hypothetical prote